MAGKKTNPSSLVVPANTRFVIDEDGDAICGAVNKAGNPCRGKPTQNGRCRIHGGKSLKGTESPLFTHGRYSKYLPKQFGQRFDEMMMNPDLANQSEQIAILDILLTEALKEWSGGGGGNAWEELEKKRREYNRHKARKDTTTMVVVMQEILDLIASGFAKMQGSRESREIIESRRKVVESERRRRVEEHSMIPVEMIVRIIMTIGDSVRRHVRDEEAVKAIANDLAIAMGSVTVSQHQAYVQEKY